MSDYLIYIFLAYDTTTFISGYINQPFFKYNFENL